MTSSLQDKVILVTGGAGGIGAAVCRRLASQGAHIIITYNSNAERAQQLAAELPGDNHLVAHAPVDDSLSLTRLAAQVGARYGSLDGLVNNAGMTQPVPHDDLDALDDEIIDQILRVNFRGAFACVRVFKDLLMAGDSEVNCGTVINMSSIAARTGVGSNVAYCASKAAMDSMTRSLARALAPKIRVVSVAPGWVWGEYAARAEPAYIQEQIDKTPLARIAQAEDVADAVAAIFTHLTFSTGCIIPVDGGRPLL
jgi:3-oxoacyl-[acyl-carrier protein] reductase